MNARKKRQIDKAIAFLSERGRLNRVFSNPKEMQDMISLMKKHGRMLEEIQKWVNTHPAASEELTGEDCEYILNHFVVREVMNS